MKKLCQIIFVLLLFITNLTYANENIDTNTSKKLTVDIAEEHLTPDKLEANTSKDIRVCIPENHLNYNNLDTKVNSNNNFITPAFLLYAQIIIGLTILVGFIGTNWAASRASKESIKNFEASAQHQTESVQIEVISKNRQDWINTLRDEISKFIGGVHYLTLAQVGTTNIDINDSRKSIQSVMVQKSKIELLLNPTEEKSKKLTGFLVEVITLISQKDKGKEIGQTLRNVVQVTQDILKEEWEKVKDFQ